MMVVLISIATEADRASEAALVYDITASHGTYTAGNNFRQKLYKICV